MQTVSPPHTGHFSRFIAAASAAVVAVAGIFTAVPAAQADATVPSTQAPVLQRGSDHVTADDLPTVQINDGYVWAQAMIGTTVYAGGQFSNVRPAGAAINTNLTPRSNILAYDITTGNLITSFAPTINGVVKAVATSPDGTRVYVGGSFDTVNGQRRTNFAVLDAVTGELVPGLTPQIGGGGVYALAATANAVYVGGRFSQANGVARQNLAAFNTANGALLPWAPTADLQVDAMVMEPQTGNVVAGGRFYAVNSQVQRGIANLDPVSGTLNTSWEAPNVVQNGWNSGSNAGKAGIFALSADDSGVYGTGWVYADVATGNLEGVFAADAGTGNIRWISDCHGDHYGVYSSGSVVYASDHTHQCETVNLWPDSNPRLYRYVESYTTYANGTLTRSSSAGSTYKDWSGTPSPSAYNWFPDFNTGNTSGLGQAALSITGANGYISIGGEFTAVNNLGRQGLTRFSTNPPGKPKQGPRVTTANWVPVASTVTPRAARITIPANWDRDDLNLTYTLNRVGESTPVDTKTVASSWWNLPQVSLVDKNLTPGSTYTYTVTATDPDGNSRISSPVTVTITDGTPSRYADVVLDDNPSLYYRLGGSTVDWAGTNNPVYGNDVTTVTPGGVIESGSAASEFTGSTNSRVSSSQTASTASGLTQEVWFSTTSKRGGMLLGYGNSQTGSSNNHDRHVYMTNNGKLVFGVYPGSAQTIISPDSYNDGQWHHVVTTLGTEGMKLYVDGVLVASKSSVTSAQPFTGYWRIGGDNVSGWPNSPTSNYFAGSLSNVAIYSQALTAGQVATHYGIGKGLNPPTASFTSTNTDLQVAFDGTASSANAGHTIASYAWAFGDGSTGTGSTTTHTYAAAGTYTIVLTVTDDIGMTNTTTQSITVVAPNAAPEASFTEELNGLTVSVDGSGSSDTDGAIVDYSWNWGDGSADSTGMTASHTYSAAGNYTITLTLTDNNGATATATNTVTMTHAAPTAAFTAVNNGLNVTVDGSDSTAADGATLEYAWDFGDGATATGPTATHTYSAAGDYTITLTITDSLGATATTTENITVTAITYIASDDFNRIVTSGWGTADIGGDWSARFGAASDASVDSAGKITLPAGQTRNMALTEVSIPDSEASVQFSLNNAPSQGNSYVGLTSRQSSATNYTVRAWMKSDGTIWLVPRQTNTELQAVQIRGLTWAAGDVFNLKVRTTGTNPTTLQGKIWKDGTTEPTSWQLDVTDSTPALQSAGYPSLHYARAASATGTATVSFSNYRLTNLNPGAAAAAPMAAKALPVDPVINPQAAVAAFSILPEGMGVEVDGTDSAGAHGESVATYSWDFGDGEKSTEGASVTHNYDEEGTYTVTLKITDEQNKTVTTTREVEITE